MKALKIVYLSDHHMQGLAKYQMDSPFINYRIEIIFVHFAYMAALKSKLLTTLKR